MNARMPANGWPPHTRGLAHALAAAAIVLGALPAAAGVVRGTLHGTRDVEDVHTHNAYPGRASSLPRARMMAHGVVTDAVVWLEHVPASADTVIPGHRPKLAQKDQCFQPRVLPVAVGTAVDFPNMDPIFHNVFSLSPVRRFDLGRYPRGHSKRVVFTRPGLVNVYCDIHSSMAAYVLVLPHHAFARPDARGGWALPDLPAGHYVLKAWHPDLGELRRGVGLPAPGPVDVDLAY